MGDRPEPLPQDPLGKRLCLTFPYPWQPIVSPNQPEADWQTITSYPLRPRVLWKLWQDAGQLVGVRFDDLTRYGLIDIDINSPYHPRQNADTLTTIRAALETIGISRTILLRSSWSGGLHLYIPLPEVVPTFGLSSALKQCLEAQGLTITAGQLEVFPNCKTYAIKGSYSEYNAHRLPLQSASGSSLLDDDLNPISTDLGRFFEQWDSAAAGQDLRELNEAIATARTNRKGKPHRQSTVVEEWLKDLRTEMEEGWTGYGQTNHLLKTIACYGVVFEGLKGDALIQFIHDTAIHSPGYFQWCRHQHEILLRATIWARAAEGYYWRLGEDGKRSTGFHGAAAPSTETASINDQRSSDAQRRIQEAVRALLEAGTLPQTVTERAKAIVKQGLVSLKTLYRYIALWHPNHQPDLGGLADLERSCKTTALEDDPAIELAENQEEVRSPDASDSAEFYTLEKIMKGSPAEGASFPQSSAQAARRLPPSEISQASPVCQSLQPASSYGSEARSVAVELPEIEPKVEQLTLLVELWPDQPTQAQEEADCVQSLLRGDRLWVLKRLFTLWREGHEELVRSICRLHPEWGFAMTESGPVEVDS
jgi:hypothetical protein